MVYRLSELVASLLSYGSKNWKYSIVFSGFWGKRLNERGRRILCQLDEEGKATINWPMANGKTPMKRSEVLTGSKKEKWWQVATDQMDGVRNGNGFWLDIRRVLVRLSLGNRGARMAPRGKCEGTGIHHPTNANEGKMFCPVFRAIFINIGRIYMDIFKVG
jgi:hypothetical protein